MLADVSDAIALLAFVAFVVWLVYFAWLPTTETPPRCGYCKHPQRNHANGTGHCRRSRGRGQHWWDRWLDSPDWFQRLRAKRCGCQKFH